MRPPASRALLLAAPLLAAALPACFSDGGSTTVAISAGVTTGGGETGTTEAPATGVGSSGEVGTTQAGTDGSTGAPTTGAPTTGASSTGVVTTGEAGNCELAPECEAGAVETGALCDSCGVQRRTCQADCSWSPMSCEQALETCGYWRLPTGEKTWKRIPVDPGAAFAPKEPVLAALALVPQEKIYVFTATTYHVLDSDSAGWTAAGARDEVLPGIAKQALHHAAGVATEPPDTIISIVAGADAFAYRFVAAQKVFALELQVPCCGDAWKQPNAPPSPLVVRDIWGRVGDPEGWLTGDVQTLCGLDQPVPIHAYMLAIGDGWVYPLEIGHCFDFFPPIPFGQFAPFTYPGAPANELIAGAVWLDGLWIFR